jgi:hypothetical protein
MIMMETSKELFYNEPNTGPTEANLVIRKRRIEHGGLFHMEYPRDVNDPTNPLYDVSLEPKKGVKQV